MAYSIRKKQIFFFSGLAGFLIFRAVPVWAAGGENVPFSLGIFLFSFAIVYLLFRAYREGYRERGWFEFRLFLWIMAAWCVFTITTGWLHGSLEPESFVRNAGGGIESFIVRDFSGALYYLGRFNDLFLVPAFIFLLLALKKWSRQE